VLVHGLGGTSTDTWKHVIALLAEEFRVVAYDLRGAGQSEVTPGPYTIDLLAEDLDTLLDGLDLGAAALVGHSMGGAVVLLEAALRPDRVSAVAGVGAAVRPNEQQREGMALRAETVERDGMNAVAETVATNGTAPSWREQNPEEFQELVSLLGSANVEGYAAACRAVATTAVEEHLGSITAPVLLVAGQLDAVSPPAVNRELAGLLLAASVVEIPDCAHQVGWEKPDDLLAALLPFLREHA
jgi:3-oxoadipate enol-lactonase